MTVNYWKI